MPGSNNGDTGWFAADTSADRYTSSDFFVPSGVAFVASGAGSFGNRSTVTHKANASTDGLPFAADTVVTVPPAFIDGNLKNLYVVSASGTINVYLLFPQKNASL